MQRLSPPSILIGLLVGLGVGFFAGWERALPEPAAGKGTVAPPPGRPAWPRVSFAQNGEDLIVRGVFDALKVARPSYIDIGAYHPVVNNNTYLLYEGGSRGVLVEPNPAFTAMLKEKRPGDRVLPIGIGLGDDAAADYYVFDGPGQDNTFSRQQADELVKAHGKAALKAVLKIPLRNINHVLEQEFPDGGPDFFSIDIEGMDLDVLKTLDFARHRPKVICVETTALGVAHVDEQIGALLRGKGYEARGGNLVNTVFVDRALWKGR